MLATIRHQIASLQPKGLHTIWTFLNPALLFHHPEHLCSPSSRIFTWLCLRAGANSWQRFIVKEQSGKSWFCRLWSGYLRVSHRNLTPSYTRLFFHRFSFIKLLFWRRASDKNLYLGCTKLAEPVYSSLQDTLGVSLGITQQLYTTISELRKFQVSLSHCLGAGEKHGQS